MKLNIMGEDYSFKQVDKFSAEIKGVHKKYCDCSYDGLTNFENKMIEVLKYKDKNYEYNHVSRHELIHAFLYEASGDAYAHDERLVEILNVIIPKFNEAYNKVRRD